jgi:O-acetyl-ADP-ribose deacetylase (regulator of RNase III)
MTHVDRITSNLTMTEGDLLRQDVEVIVNAWNRNVLPWWLLLPQGVSGAIKREAGTQPFRELSRHGPVKLGHAVLTSAGRLPYKAIIHVAGINLLWRASEYSIRKSVSSAIALAESHEFGSIAFPAIGSGSGGFDANRSLEIMAAEVQRIGTRINVILVRYRK